MTEIVGVILSRASYDWKPGWQFDWVILRGNIMLNASLIYVRLAFLATVRVQEMAIGAGIGLAAVGVYRTAWRTVEADRPRRDPALRRSRCRRSRGSGTTPPSCARPIAG